MGYNINRNEIDSIMRNLNKEETKKYCKYIENMQPQTAIYSIFALISEEISYCPYWWKISFNDFNSTIVQKVTLDININIIDIMLMI